MGDGERPAFYIIHLLLATQIPKTDISDPFFLINKISMGGNSRGFEPGREQHNGSGLYVLDSTQHYQSTTYKNPTKAMGPKLLMWLYTILPSTGYSLVILLNIDNIKGVVLFIVAVLYGIARLYFYIVKQNQERRMRELDIREKKRWLDIGDPI